MDDFSARHSPRAEKSHCRAGCGAAAVTASKAVQMQGSASPQKEGSTAGDEQERERLNS